MTFWYMVSFSLVTWYNFNFPKRKILCNISDNNEWFKVWIYIYFAMIYLKGIFCKYARWSNWCGQVIVIWSRWFAHTRLHCSHPVRTCDLQCALFHCFKVNVYFRRLNLHTFLVYPFWYQVYPIVILVKARRALIC